MFHLFNKVYLSFDFALDSSNRWIMLSQKFGTFPFIGDVEIQKEYCEVSYEELVEEHFDGKDQNFFDYLQAFDVNRKLVIYCDQDAFNLILTKHLKALLPNITTSAAYLIFRYTLAKMKCINAFREPLTSSQKDGYDSLVIQSEEDFSFDFEDTFPVAPYSQYTKISSSIEWLLASFLTNPTSVYGKEFEERMFKVCWKDIAWEVEELKRNILSAVVDINVLYPEIPQITRIDSSTLTTLTAEHPKLRFLTDRLCTPNNISTVKAYGAAFFKEHLQKIRSKFLEDDQFVYSLLDLLASDTTTARDLIDFDMSFGFGTQLLARSEYTETMNPLLISYIYRLVREDKSASILPFSL